MINKTHFYMYVWSTSLKHESESAKLVDSMTGTREVI